ncbi:MAG: hypothetical protein AB4290_26175 [Spirulina sp.]
MCHATRGWREQNRIPDRLSIWTRETFAEDGLKIQLPLDREFDDYSLRMSEIMEILEKTEQQSQLDIIRELITAIDNITIQGMVIQLHSPNRDRLSGEISILGVVVNKLYKIKTELFDRDYILAIKAYQERLPISCQGDLVRENGIFILKNPDCLTLEINDRQ